MLTSAFWVTLAVALAYYATVGIIYSVDPYFRSQYGMGSLGSLGLIMIIINFLTLFTMPFIVNCMLTGNCHKLTMAVTVVIVASLLLTIIMMIKMSMSARNGVQYNGYMCQESGGYYDYRMEECVDAESYNSCIDGKSAWLDGSCVKQSVIEECYHQGRIFVGDACVTVEEQVACDADGKMFYKGTCSRPKPVY